MLVVTRSPVGTCSTRVPSGAITEMQPEISVATLISGCVSVIAPDGTIVEQVPTGDRVTTNIAFGGPDLKTAYITLSGKGELVAMDWARPGLALNFLNK